MNSTVYFLVSSRFCDLEFKELIPGNKFEKEPRCEYEPICVFIHSTLVVVGYPVWKIPIAIQFGISKLTFQIAIFNIYRRALFDLNMLVAFSGNVSFGGH